MRNMTVSVSRTGRAGRAVNISSRLPTGWPKLSAWVWLLAGLLMLVLLDQWAPQAAQLTLAGVSISVALLHGALDAVLLQRQGPAVRHALGAAALYLGITLLAGWLALQWPAQALMLLLPLSIWHFGESFGLAPSASVWTHGIRRLVRGGAPVALPMLLSADAMRALIEPFARIGTNDAATLLLLWNTLAVGWLALALGWGIAQSMRPARSAIDRDIAAEIGMLAILYLLLSPVLAFAAFFGVLHCGAHIVRVLKERSGVDQWLAAPERIVLLLTTLLSLSIVAAWVLVLPGTGVMVSPDPAMLVFVVAALAAVSLPHAILISRSAARLPSVTMRLH